MITLKPLKEEYIEQIRIWRTSEEVSKYLLTQPKITQKDQIKWFNKVKNDSTCKYWVIFSDEIPIGLASIFNITDKSCYWGLFIGDISYQGKGLGKEIMFNLFNYIFNELNLQEAYCEVLTLNIKAINLYFIMRAKIKELKESSYIMIIKKENWT